MSLAIPKKKVPKKPNIGVVIQARMTSKRFPGKTMALLNGKPVLRHVIERCKQIGNSNTKVIVAVPDTDESEPMLVLADKLGVHNFCGSENNVLERYYHAAKFFELDVIMRITADCPLISPTVCNEVLDVSLWRKTDYCSNIFPVRTYPKGLDCEVFTLDTLECAYLLAKENEEKEHVTIWMQNNSSDLRTACVTQKVDKSEDNWCVDYPHDIPRLENIIALLSKTKGKKNGNGRSH